MAHLTSRANLAAIALATLALGASLAGCSANGQARLSSKSAEASGDASFSSHKAGEKSTRLGDARLGPEVCASYDLTPETRRLNHYAIEKLLREQGFSFTKTTERGDLHLYDVEKDGYVARLRVATLKTQREAGRHLHNALLQHGRDYWGVHRGNLAVLGPPGATDEAIGFAVETGLACWGVLTVAGRDDTFVIPGGYIEL